MNKKCIKNTLKNTLKIHHSTSHQSDSVQPDSHFSAGIRQPDYVIGLMVKIGIKKIELN